MTPTPEFRNHLRLAPALPKIMFQRWEQLLFLHWKMDPAQIQKTLPEGLTVDTYDGHAWVAVVPFFMRGIRPRFLPSVPGISDFLELNLRTYVHDAQGRPGVWFYSLDCHQALAVWIARTFFHLPYQRARMSQSVSPDGGVTYTSQRLGQDHTATFRYRLSQETREAEPGSLDFFLTERYLLFSQTPSGLRLGRVHHRPYPLSEVTLDAWDAQLFALNGLPVPATPPDHIIGSAGVDVSIYPLQSFA